MPPPPAQSPTATTSRGSGVASQEQYNSARGLVKAFAEAEAYPGPSLIITYAHCIAHGFNLTNGYEEQKKAVASGHWPLFRFDPRLKEQGQNPLQLDSKPPTMTFEDYAYGEDRYRVLKQSKPDVAASLMKLANKDAVDRYALMEQLAQIKTEKNGQGAA